MTDSQTSSSNPSYDSGQANSSSSSILETNLIRKCLASQLDKENYAKFKEVLEYVGQQVYVPLYQGYNDHLLSQFQNISTYSQSFPQGYTPDQHVGLKIKFYSFRFITNIGRHLHSLFDKGDVKAEKYFVIVIKIILHHSLVSKSNSANFALVELEQLCLIYKLSPQELYQRYRHKLLRLIIKAILQKLAANEDSNSYRTNACPPMNAIGINGVKKNNLVVTYMTRAFEIFNVVTISADDMEQSLIIITNLMHKGRYNDAIRVFLENLARHQNIDVYTMIRAHIQSIIVSMLLRRKLSQFDMTASLETLSKICDKTPKDILATKYQNIKGRILLEYSVDKKLVADALYYLSKFEKADNEQPFEEALEDETIFIDYIKPHMIGILHGIDSYFTVKRKSLGDPESLAHIRSLTQLLSMIGGEQINSIHHKLLSTLSLLLRLRPTRDNLELNIELIEAWKVYLKNLKKDHKVSLVVNIAVALCDLIEDCPHLVSELYLELLSYQKTKDNVGSLRSLYFIPDIPEFKQIYKILSPHISKSVEVSNLADLQQRLDDALPLLKYESQKCHAIALKKISELLKANQKLITSNMLVNLDEPLERILSNTIASVLTVSSTQESECSTLIAQCLGIVGAVNPVRLDHLIFGKIPEGAKVQAEQPTCIVSLSDANFIAGLVELLQNSLFSDRRSESEVANYALQVVVQTLDVLNSTSISRRLTPEAAKACRLCKNTNYMGIPRTPLGINTSVFLKFKSVNQYSYSEWLDKFSQILISDIEDSKIERILDACAYLFRYNLKFAEYILPIVVTHIVLNQPRKIEIIHREVMAIINEDSGVSTQDIDTVYSRNARANLQTLHIQCANMTFCLLDALAKLEMNTNQANLLDKAQLKRLKEFNLSVPKEKLAMLANTSRAYARALCYFDQYFFENKDWFPSAVQQSNGESRKDTDKYLIALQKVYIALEDSYDASGVDKLRMKPTSFSDELTNHESSGNFDDAFTWYSALLEVHDNINEKEPFVEDSLRCLSNQGNDQQLYLMSKQLLTDYPQLKQNILPAAIEACWKLRKWDELKSTFNHEQCDTLLEQAPVSYGYLLSSFCESRQDTFERVRLVRNKLMKPLSISLMDKNAYFRGYQSLLVLHGVEDFSLALEALRDNPYATQQLDENTIDEMRAQLSVKFDSLFDMWNSRNKLVQPSQKSLEPLLGWQRSIAAALSERYPFLSRKIHIDIGKMWLASADSARRARSFGRSAYCLARARVWFGNSDFHKLELDLRVEYTTIQAKHHWDNNRQTDAINSLKLAFQRMQEHPLHRHLKNLRDQSEINRALKNSLSEDPFPDLENRSPCRDCEKFSVADRNSFSKILTLLTRFNEEAAASMPDAMLRMYTECHHLDVNHEEVYLCLARYYDKLATFYVDNPQINDYSQAEKLYLRQIKERSILGFEKSSKLSQTGADPDLEDTCTNLMEHSITAFGMSMKYGARFIEESMPRMLNIWFDLGGKKQPNPRVPTRVISSRIEKTVRFIDSLVRQKVIPSYYFLTAISLLLSRVCHPHSGVTKTTAEILQRLLIDFPHQIMWRLIAMLNDENGERKRAATKLITLARKEDSRIAPIVMETARFSDILRKLCISHSSYDTNSSRKKLPPGIIDVRQIEPQAHNLKLNDTNVLMPTQTSMQAILPSTTDLDNLANYNVFPRHRVAYIRSIETKARVFNSLQAPRQIGFKCDNGEVVNLLCKPGDDLRKDSRCIEFFSLLNRVLRKNSQSNAKFFEISTFLVLPLQPNAGIIEMIPNLQTVRSVVERLYKESKGQAFNIHDAGLPKRQRANDGTSLELYRAYVNKVLPKVSPPVLQNFYLKNFSDPTSWYLAKLAYVRSTAVISMGGYIIGLGDRHLDNILLDVKHGRVVHVDFNLLFHQAETLPCPEVVPFRLTNNIVSAFGPVGVEGNFRKFCEIALQAMRDEKEALLTTLKPFVHDPCSEWTRKDTALEKVISRKSLDNCGEINFGELKDENNLRAKGKNDRTNLNDSIFQKDKCDKKAKASCENDSAKSRIEVVERKLKGFPRSKEFKPLSMLNSYSVEAQVDKLIEEASDYYNLSQMYYGWCPHI